VVKLAVSSVPYAAWVRKNVVESVEVQASVVPGPSSGEAIPF
jgi:hypothetical protein